MTATSIRVTCALIHRDDRLLAVRRSATMSQPGKWEFPGGKVQAGESDQDCLRRELAEELGLEVRILRQMTAVLHHYPDKSIELVPFVCQWTGGTLHLYEHDAWGWFGPDELSALDWSAADVPILAEWLAL